MTIFLEEICCQANKPGYPKVDGIAQLEEEEKERCGEHQ